MSLFGKVWKFTTKDTVVINLPYSVDQQYAFYEGDKLVGFLNKNRLTCYKGYEWDGCTPKVRIFGNIIGVPDFEKTKIPSLAHDMLIEFWYVHSLTREQIDNIFDFLLKKNGFKLRWLYAGTVHNFRKFIRFYRNV